MTTIINDSATANDLISLGSIADIGSFLVPCLGFATADQLMAEQANNQADEDTSRGLAIGGRACFQPLFSGRCSYLPYNRGDGLEVQSLLEGDPRLQLGKPSWARLWDKDATKPEGAYNVGLMVEGRRQFSTWARRTTKRPAWWYRLNDGSHDCATAWSRHDGAEQGGNITIDSQTRLYAARSGRGAIYTMRTTFDNEGRPDGFKTGLVLVEFSILDRDPTKDDMLKVQLVASRSAISYRTDRAAEVHLEDLDPVWQGLAQKARNTFERFCKPVSDEVEQWRVNFLDQRKNYLDQKRFSRGAATFFDGIKSLSWQEALQVVQEPWQLKVVIDHHCDSRFDTSVHRSDTNGSRVGLMLSRFDCHQERRAELQRMVSDFVAPTDPLWSYSGD